MDCPVISEVSPESNSGLWRKRFMKKKRFKRGLKVMMKQVSWLDHKVVTSQEETGEDMADEMSQKVDSRDDVMDVENSDQ